MPVPAGCRASRCFASGNSCRLLSLGNSPVTRVVFSFGRRQRRRGFGNQCRRLTQTIWQGRFISRHRTSRRPTPGSDLITFCKPGVMRRRASFFDSLGIDDSHFREVPGISAVVAGPGSRSSPSRQHRVSGNARSAGSRRSGRAVQCPCSRFSRRRDSGRPG